jgi:hypothetical protein
MACGPKEGRSAGRGAEIYFSFQRNIWEAVFRMRPQVIDSSGKTE